jgi:hypothetical protein
MDVFGHPDPVAQQRASGQRVDGQDRHRLLGTPDGGDQLTGECGLARTRGPGDSDDVAGRPVQAESFDRMIGAVVACFDPASREISETSRSE